MQSVFVKSIRQMWSCLTAQERSDLVKISVVVVVVSFFEMLGIAFVFPFLKIVASQKIPPTVTNYSLKLLGSVPNYNTVVLILGSAAIALILIANVVLFLGSRYSLDKIQIITHQLSLRLYRYYLSREIEFHQASGATDLNTKIGFLKGIGNGFLNGLVQMLAKVVLIIVLFGGLIYVNATAAFVSAFTLTGAYVLIFKTLRQRIRMHSQTYKENTVIRYKAIVESFRGIRDVKMSSIEQYYLTAFDRGGLKMAHSESSRHSLSVLPKYLVEAVGFTGLIIFVLTLSLSGRDFGEIISQIVIFAIIGYKLLPGIQGAFSSYVAALSQIPMIDDLYVELKQSNLYEKRESENAQHFEGIVFKDVDYNLDNGKSLLSKVNLQILSGETIGVAGPSGAGKTTFIELLMGLRNPSSGDIELLSSDKPRRLREIFAYTPQNVLALNDTLLNNITLRSHAFDENLLNQAVWASCLNELMLDRNVDLNFVLSEEGGTFSGGQRQRIGIARSVYLNRPVIILDESTSALDPAIEKEIFTRLMTLNKTIVFVSHRPNLFAYSKKIVTIENGSITCFMNQNDAMRSSDFFQKFNSH